ncbi:uncharacterized protein LOC132547034 isoform X2 [Ylistrum balloti]|uniref:uncharacterized protein LOC132547034 isoform X2 n=1 Tax=Ylistrum balloti TaxID=509963 RepID=UPI002905DCC5|nr:uncharacterized protein LOC132547034 isoform X2 [Ylistrum balloti]
MKHLNRLSAAVVDINRPLSNYFTFGTTSINGNMKKTEKIKECPYCGHTYQQPEDRSRLQAKIPLTGKVRQLLRKYVQNKRSLGKYQLHMVDRYLTSTNSVKITCSVCGKSEKMPGQLREKREAQKKAQAVLPVEISDVTMKTRKEKRKELKLKNKQRKRDKLKESNLNAIPSSCLSLDSSTNTDIGFGSMPSSTAELTGNIHSNSLTTATSQRISKDTVTRKSVQNLDKDIVTPKSEQSHNKDTMTPKSGTSNNKDTMTPKSGTSNNKDTMTSRIIQSYIKDKETKPVVVNVKSAKRLKSKSSHQQLSQMLAQQSKGSPGGSLKDFLSSL